MMVRYFLSLIVSLVMVQSAFANVQSDVQNKARIEAAKRLEKITPVEDMLNNLIQEMGNNLTSATQLPLPEEQKKELVNVMREVMDPKEMKPIVIQAMAKHFTVAEMEAMAKFNSSAEGKSATKKMPAYMNDFMPYVQQKTIEAFEIMMKREAAKAGNE